MSDFLNLCSRWFNRLDNTRYWARSLLLIILLTFLTFGVDSCTAQIGFPLSIERSWANIPINMFVIGVVLFGAFLLAKKGRIDRDKLSSGVSVLLVYVSAYSFCALALTLEFVGVSVNPGLEYLSHFLNPIVVAGWIPAVLEFGNPLATVWIAGVLGLVFELGYMFPREKFKSFGILLILFSILSLLVTLMAIKL